MFSGPLQTIRNTHATMLVDSITFLNSAADCTHLSTFDRIHPRSEKKNAIRSGESASDYFARLFQNENEFLSAD
jgi:hypothetical protein